jgi:hypothetical protein
VYGEEPVWWATPIYCDQARNSSILKWISQVQAIVTRKKEWLRAIALDSKTGLDPTDSGIKVRAAQGLDAASYFVTGYWIWSKIIENLAAIDYDYNDCERQVPSCNRQKFCGINTLASQYHSKLTIGDFPT